MQVKKNTHLSILNEFSLNIVQYMQWKQCRDCYQFLNFIKICPLYHDKRQSFTPFDLLFFPWLFNWCYFRSSDHFLQSFTQPLNIKAAEAPHNGGRCGGRCGGGGVAGWRFSCCRQTLFFWRRQSSQQEKSPNELRTPKPASTTTRKGLATPY